ncbi:hypothetical protein [Vallitalea okinawensis]|uniref:hypothetical protein n=1 Tax=Vallitalea okinawensis TaxID=2078660 RepID=UPI000CFC8A06|nr:hypothetical protein [Vallitalea okinawensis]
MKLIMTLNKAILRELFLPFTICLGSFLAVWVGLYITGLMNLEDLTSSIGGSLINVFLIFSMILIFDFLSTKSRILITLNYDRGFIAKYNLVLHLLLILINSLIIISGVAFTSFIVINGEVLSETTYSFTGNFLTAFIALLLLIDYISTIICVFINYGKTSGFLYLTATLIIIGFILIQYTSTLYSFYNQSPLIFSLIIGTLCLLMEVFIYREIKHFEIKR